MNKKQAAELLQQKQQQVYAVFMCGGTNGMDNNELKVLVDVAKSLHDS